LAVVLGVRDGIGAVEIGLFCAFYLLTMLGITVGFHRHASHNAFGARLTIRWVLLGLGSMAAQGPLFYWVTNHRRHHRESDRSGDPHSPHFDGTQALGKIRGLLHAHLGWTFAHELTKDQSRNHVVVALLTAGDGWHNNHHAFPFSAYAGIERWQIDMSGWCITALEKLSLACNVKRPSEVAIERARHARRYEQDNSVQPGDMGRN